MDKVEVSVEFVKKAFNSACPEWKRKIVNEFPMIDFGFVKKGTYMKSKETDLVVFVTESSTNNTSFSGFVVIPDDNTHIGYYSEAWRTNLGEEYTGDPIDLNKIFNNK